MKGLLNKIIFFIFLILSNNINAKNNINIDSIASIKNSTNIQIARLSIIDVESAQKNLLKNNNQIAGYPIKGRIIDLKIDEKSSISEALLNNINYISLRNRCENDFFIGLRFFTKNNEKIEFALGTPCNQAIWAIPPVSSPKSWGSVISKPTAEKIQKIFNKYKL